MKQEDGAAIGACVEKAKNVKFFSATDASVIHFSGRLRE
jgi:hypothetical protein